MRKYVTNYKPISSQSARKWLSNWCGSTNEKSFPRLFFSCLGEERAVLCAAAVAWSASVCSFSVAQNSEPFSGSGFSQTGPCSSGPFRLSDSGAGVEGVDGMLMLGVGGLMGPLASWVRALAGGWACVWSWGESGSVCGVFGECCRCRSLSSCLASWSCGWGGTQTDKNRHEKTNGEQKDARTAWENVSTRDAQTHTKKKDQLGTRKTNSSALHKIDDVCLLSLWTQRVHSGATALPDVRRTKHITECAELFFLLCQHTSAAQTYGNAHEYALKKIRHAV